MGEGLNPVPHPLTLFAIGIFFPKSTHVPNPGRGKIILDPEIVSPLRDQGIVRPGNHAFRDHLATDNPLGFDSNVIKALCGKNNQTLKRGYRAPGSHRIPRRIGADINLILDCGPRRNRGPIAHGRHRIPRYSDLVCNLPTMPLYSGQGSRPPRGAWIETTKGGTNCTPLF